MPADRLRKRRELGNRPRGDEDESEIFYVREKLDREILPVKAAAEYADNG